MNEASEEIARGERFDFGENWSRFLRGIDEESIGQAVASLTGMLGVTTLEGKRFLDAGSGSGLFSLAARRLGATVHSFDFDPGSVACTAELRRRYSDDRHWCIEQGSVLDEKYMDPAILGMFDVVYSWGVLHHTGDMWRALALVEPLVGPGGKLFIAIYNDQGRISHGWRAVKKLYNRGPRVVRPLLVAGVATRVLARPIVLDVLAGHPFRTLTTRRGRGMSLFHDIIDWVGGYPYEVATPEQIFDFYRARGLSLSRLKTCGGGLGNNQFVFERSGSDPMTPTKLSFQP